jgi:apolipoprotein N-acyltransferase
LAGDRGEGRVGISFKASAAGEIDRLVGEASAGVGATSATGLALQRAALAAASGVLYALAFPPASLGLLAWVALVPLFCALARVRSAGAALLGLLFALTATVGVAAWLPDAVARFFHVSHAAGWLALLGAALLPVGLPLAAFAAWTSWALRRGVGGPLAIGAAWAVCELLRSFASFGFDYAPLAASQVPGRFAQAADVLGACGVGALIAAANAALALPFLSTPRRREARAEAAVVAFACAAALVYGSVQSARSFAVGPEARVAVVQSGLAPGADVAAERARYRALSAPLEGRDLALVVWPEYAIRSYLRERTAASGWVRELSRQLGTDLVLGAPHYRYAQPEARYFTSAFLLRDGALSGRHDKTRLVPFAEGEYQAGRELRALQGRLRVGAFLCAELLDPGVARGLARDGAELFANPANDFWLAPAASAHMLQIAGLRAIENRRPLLRATPTGDSAVIDAHGRVLASSRGRGAEVLEATVHPSHARTLAQRIGDGPAWLAGLTLLGITVIATSKVC